MPTLRIVWQRSRMTVIAAIIFAAGFSAGNLANVTSAQNRHVQPAGTEAVFESFWQVWDIIHDEFVDPEGNELLAETLVVAIAEFGRTPTINSAGGRDHWGSVFSFAMAGAGVQAGTVYGASDNVGAYPARDRVNPEDVTATLFHLLGIPHTSKFRDAQGREHFITEGSPIDGILDRGELTDYHWAHSARGDLLRRAGRADEARRSYERALALTRQEPERRFLETRLAELDRSH